MDWTDRYLQYVSAVRRYSPRTVEIYRGVLERFCAYSGQPGEELPSMLTPARVRNYEVWLLDELKESPRTVNLHLSVLSGCSRFLLKAGVLEANPVKLIHRPKTPKRLPQVFRGEDMDRYLESTRADGEAESLSLIVGKDKVSAELWTRRRDRLVVRMLYDTGLRRSELIGLDRSHVDTARRTLRVRGKGGKMREIPLTDSLCEEILLYLEATNRMLGESPVPLLVTAQGGRLYPMAVERIVKAQTGAAGVAGKRSPHVLRHTIATQLLDAGTDLNAIKEMLGHSSLAATQVYTHTSVEKLKAAYAKAHPRAKNK
ncbi:MAG: tyrosine-type recombinase/integrase [Bacteroidales bacterium]|nr:tyrosine-type recombinase/integrase [Bacteroidales bacterium]